MDFLRQTILANTTVQQYGIPITAAIIGLRVLWSLNSWLSQQALNHYTSSSPWNAKKELVVVTGGSSGIGAAIFKRLASDGVKVIILDINQPLTPVQSPYVHFYTCDISSLSAISTVADQIREKHGNPTVLVNNAGIATDHTVIDLSMERIQKILVVNHISHYALIKEFLPAMIAAQHGHIVTVASMAHCCPRAASIPYAASKGAAINLHEGLSQELAVCYNAPRIRTTIVHPGWVNTPLADSLVEQGLKVSMDSPEYIADRVVSQLYSGNSGTLYLPSPLMGLMATIRAWPHWLQESLRTHVTNSVIEYARKSAKAEKLRGQ